MTPQITKIIRYSVQGFKPLSSYINTKILRKSSLSPITNFSLKMHQKLTLISYSKREINNVTKISNQNKIKEMYQMTLQTTKIIRYSVQGFKPQYQSEHLKNINYHLNDFNINDFPEHLRHIIQKQHEVHISFYKEHYQDFQYGIWFFIDGHKNNQSLNHLKHKVPCWEAEIEDDVLLYDVN